MKEIITMKEMITGVRGKKVSKMQLMGILMLVTIVTNLLNNQAVAAIPYLIQAKIALK